MYAALGCEERQRIVDAHGENFADAPALEQNGQSFRIEALAAADIAQYLHVGQEAHLDALHSLAFAGLAAAAGGVEGKPAGGEPAHARPGGVRVDARDGVPET